MKTYPILSFILILVQAMLSSCGANVTQLEYSNRMLDELETSEEIIQRGDWRLKTFTTPEGLKLLVVTGKPEKKIDFRALFEDKLAPPKAHDRRLDSFRWNEGFETKSVCRNLSDGLFEEVTEWISDHGDWDEEDSSLRWEDSWISSILDGNNPYPRYKDIHEVWVVECGVEVEALDRDSTHIAQWACMGLLPFGIISFYPEHTEVGRGTVRIRVYDSLNRRFRAEKELKVETERSRIHSWGSDWLGVITCGAFNISSRGTFFWIPCYDTDSPGVVSTILDEIEELEDGVQDLFDGVNATRPDTEPAHLRLRSEGGKVDSSRVANIPVVVTNTGRGESLNVIVHVKVRNSPDLEGIAPEKVELGDLKPGDSIERIIRFRIPSTFKEKELILVLEPKDESPQEYRKVQVRVPLK
ncbi:MAG: hypothetical protein AB7F75_07440 [Planctomycetota bacterium]